MIILGQEVGGLLIVFGSILLMMYLFYLLDRYVMNKEDYLNHDKNVKGEKSE